MTKLYILHENLSNEIDTNIFILSENISSDIDTDTITTLQEISNNISTTLREVCNYIPANLEVCNYIPAILQEVCNYIPGTWAFGTLIVLGDLILGIISLMDAHIAEEGRIINQYMDFYDEMHKRDRNYGSPDLAYVHVQPESACWTSNLIGPFNLNNLRTAWMGRRATRFMSQVSTGSYFIFQTNNYLGTQLDRIRAYGEYVSGVRACVHIDGQLYSGFIVENIELGTTPGTVGYPVKMSVRPVTDMITSMHLPVRFYLPTSGSWALAEVRPYHSFPDTYQGLANANFRPRMLNAAEIWRQAQSGH